MYLRRFRLSFGDRKHRKHDVRVISSIASHVVCYTAVFSDVTQQWGGALRDDTKNGCVADYLPRRRS